MGEAQIFRIEVLIFNLEKAGGNIRFQGWIFRYPKIPWKYRAAATPDDSRRPANISVYRKRFGLAGRGLN
ncbi:hypothetical protein UR09_01795 [Candidatus Nitromaritima sp. SCGC AAA799-A02]|nr:hypothetical protein UR09_01795 [Candidatus Nitromaritima sp. SCGC AAA799-A02]